jgi:ABC-2 type transport system permease protein
MIAVVRTFIVVTVVLMVGLCFGARPTDWAIGIPLFYVTCIGMTIISSGWGLGLAFRFRDMRAAALMQLTLFLVMFTSSAQAPMNIMRGWLLHVARINPATNVLRLARQAFLQNPAGGVTWDHTYGGLLALVGLGLVTSIFAYTGLRSLDR